jgi:hypothetical protein
MSKIPLNIQDNFKIIAFIPNGNIETVVNLRRLYPANTYFYVLGDHTYYAPNGFIGRTWFIVKDKIGSFWDASYVLSSELPERIQAWKVLLELK